VTIFKRAKDVVNDLNHCFTLSRALSVHEQGGRICIWVQVDTSQLMVNKYFAVVGTWWDLNAPKRIGNMKWDRFIGTAFVGALVWHVFEVTP
jgi:hypothetical protein